MGGRSLFSNDDGNGGVENGTRMRAGCWFVCRDRCAAEAEDGIG